MRSPMVVPVPGEQGEHVLSPQRQFYMAYMDAAIGSVSTFDYTTTASLEHYKNGEYGKRKVAKGEHGGAAREHE